jgi:iron complex outermembrane receptor protein
MGGTRNHRYESNWVRQLLVTTALTATVAMAGPALAQDAPASDTPPPASGSRAAQAASDEIVVTASRTAQDGLQAPTPTQVIGAEVIARQAAACR